MSNLAQILAKQIVPRIIDGIIEAIVNSTIPVKSGSAQSIGRGAAKRWLKMHARRQLKKR